MVYKASNKIYDFRNFKTIRACGNEIKNNVIDIDTANGEQTDLLKYIKIYLSIAQDQIIRYQKT